MPFWEAKTAPKSIPKRSKIEAKNQEEKKSIQDDLGPILGRSWAVLGRHLGRRNAPNPYKTYCFVNNHFFEDKTVRRGFWDQLGPTKSQNEPILGPKREPKTTPRRSKIDIKIDQKNESKTKRARHRTSLVVSAGTPPWGAPGRRPRSPGEAPQAPIKS